MRIRLSRADEQGRLFQIWRDAVDATHHFLSPEDRAAIEEQVQAFLRQMPLWLATDANGHVVGFMGLSHSHMDSLFIDPAFHGLGVGRMLVEHAIALYPALATDVNEQSAQAMGFYERLGFVRTGRSEVDDQRRPYPLIYLRLG